MTVLRRALVLMAAGFLAFEIYGAVQWLRQPGGVGAGLESFARAVGSDWAALVTVADLLLVGAVVLMALWLDAARQGWSAGRRVLLALAFAALGSPVLLTYIAWRLGRWR